MTASSGFVAVVSSTYFPIFVPDQRLILWGDGIHDDTAAIQQLVNRAGAWAVLPIGRYLVSDTIYLPGSFDGQDSTLIADSGMNERPVLRMDNDPSRVKVLQNVYVEMSSASDSYAVLLRGNQQA